MAHPHEIQLVSYRNGSVTLYYASGNVLVGSVRHESGMHTAIPEAPNWPQVPFRTALAAEAYLRAVRFDHLPA